MTTQTKRPTYKQLMRPRRVMTHELAPITQRIIALSPGGVLDVTPDDGKLTDERGRMASRMRTARLHTGWRYRCLTHEGRLFVVCERED